MDVGAELEAEELHFLLDVPTWGVQVLNFKFAALLLRNRVIKGFCYAVSGVGTYLGRVGHTMLDFELITPNFSELVIILRLAIYKHLMSL